MKIETVLRVGTLINVTRITEYFNFVYILICLYGIFENSLSIIKSVCVCGLALKVIAINIIWNATMYNIVGNRPEVDILCRHMYWT